jgi:hypothetical protein
LQTHLGNFFNHIDRLFTYASRLPLAARFRLGIFARCGKILMAAEPGNSQYRLTGFGVRSVSPIGIKILQQSLQAGGDK